MPDDSSQDRTSAALAVTLTALACLLFGLIHSQIGLRPDAPTPQADPPPEPEPVDIVNVIEEDVGRSVEGRPIRQIRLGTGDYVILMIATIHGNESAGTPLLERLSERLQQQPERLEGCTVVLLPLVNPDGVEGNTRLNAQGVDLNRNFPAENRQNSRRFGMKALSEPEATAIFQVVARWLPRHIVTLHEPLQCVDYDGPAAELAQLMSAHCPLPVKKLGSRPGSLGSFAGLTLDIPIITFELARKARSQEPDELWHLYGESLLSAVDYRAEPTGDAPVEGARSRSAK